MKKTAQKIKFLEVKFWGVPLTTTLIVIVFLSVGAFLKNKNKQPVVQVPQETPSVVNPDIIPLPTPTYRSQNSIEAVLRVNQPRRGFEPTELSLKQISQMLWAAQGVVTDWGGRTVASSKSTFPLTVYLFANNVEKLEKGIYQYIPGERLPAHQLLPLKQGDFSDTLYDIVNQTPLKQPPAVVIITGNLKKMAEAYGGVAHDKEVYLEAGATAQNMYLQAESLKIGTIAISNFDKENVRLLLSIPQELDIIYLTPMGYIKE